MRQTQSTKPAGANAMDDAQPIRPVAGSNDRRRTVSGALSDYFQDDGTAEPSETMHFPWSSPSAPASPGLTSSSATQGAPPSPGRSAAHKRALPSNILSKFSVLRHAETGSPPSQEDKAQEEHAFKPRKSTDDDGEPSSPVSPAKVEHALTAALKPTKTRKRKGSLRKTALLGGKRLVHEGRERRNSLLQRSPSSKAPSNPALQHTAATGLDSASEPRNYASAPDTDHWPPSAAVSAARLSLVTDYTAPQGPKAVGGAVDDLGSPLDLKSPLSQTSYASTTDDDDVLTFDRPVGGSSSSGYALPSSATGYFPPVVAASGSEAVRTRRRSRSKQPRSSPLSHSTSALAAFPEPEPHDYTETEYWGWVILFVTWLTFAVGMGSCLDIWSWAWDVGETPYAPPELEDDPTLPIVGYYPALIVLTGVVAWVWITVAWIGMKYFRHAKIEV